MRWSAGAVLLMVISGCLAGCSRSTQANPSAPGFEPHVLETGGLSRTYLLRVPPALEGGPPAPLVLVLHGGGGNAGQVCQMGGGVAALADSQGFVVACPQGVEGHWNDGRQIEDYRAMSAGIDDVQFLKSVVQDVAERVPIDRSRVYVTGLSNGGMMTLRAACDAPGTFAAAGAVIANLPTQLDCQPSRPISVLLMNGTDDPLMPWAGGQVHFLRRQLGPVRSTSDTFGYWAGVDGCLGPAHESRLPDLDPGDQTRVTLASYQNCADGTQVELYTIEGGGHTLPGGDQYMPAFLVGRVNHDLDGAAAIWEFFSQHAMPG